MTSEPISYNCVWHLLILWNQIVLQDPQHHQEFNVGKKLFEERVEAEFMTLVTWVPTFNMVSDPSLNLPYYPL